MVAQLSPDPRSGPLFLRFPLSWRYGFLAPKVDELKGFPIPERRFQRTERGTWRRKRFRLLAGLPAALAALLSGPAAAEEEISIEFGRGVGETRIVHFDDFSGSETWYMTRCQNAVTPDYYIVIRDYGDVEQIQPVNSALEADRTVCVIGHIPDIVKRYMR